MNWLRNWLRAFLKLPTAADISHLTNFVLTEVEGLESRVDARLETFIKYKKKLRRVK